MENELENAFMSVINKKKEAKAIAESNEQKYSEELTKVTKITV